ncbi:MAG: discoidin domain-containing protein, partial [Muribaculaceae bacterium]|nr:discoidin domain-containing protein [Muribaculaceae bacterium]
MTKHNILSALLFLVSLLPSLTASAERSFLITDPKQFSCSGSLPASDVFRSLIDGEKTTYWNSGSSNPAGEHYLEVDLGRPLDLAPDEDLVIYVRRADMTTDAPTTLRIEGSVNGSGWTPLAHAFFLYRGPLTEEYSARIRTDAPYRHLRFTVTANNNHSYHGATGYRTMTMAEFNIIRLKRTDDYSPSRVDRFRLKTDYVRDFENYAFKYSQGFPEEHNRWVGLTSWFDTVDKGKWDADGNWTADPEYWASSRIKMPSFTMLDSSTDPLIKEGKRQASHVTEHVLYAVPGDAIALYPYYDMPNTTAYYEKFSHWYDYTTGGDNPYLDFLIDPALIAPVRGAGFVGGTDTHGYRPNTVYINSAATFNQFADRVNAGETDLNAIMISNFAFNEEDLTMVGTLEHPYRGTFDGRGNMIDQATINYPDQDAVGIFRYVAGNATIKNLQLSATVNITGKSFVALIGVYKDCSADNTLTVENCSGDPNIYAHGINAAGILGSNWNDGAVVIRNCGFMGKLTCLGQGGTGTSEAGLLSGWLGGNTRTIVENCVARPKENNDAPQCGYYVPNGWSNGNDMLYRSWDNSAKSINNYIAASTNPGSSQGTWVTTDNGYVISGDFIKRLGGGWVEYSNWGYPRPCASAQHALRYYGTVGTFFMPRDVYAPEGILQTFPDGVEEYVIAADFAQHVADDKNYFDQQLYRPNFENGTIYEPIINSRHIFRIRDGKKFADDNMSTLEKNRAYIRANRRYVSARAGADFQIRFDSPVPKEGTTRSKWYYKISDTDYRRICTMDIHVYDASTEQLISTDNSIFFPGEEFYGQGSREIDYVNYNVCGGGGSYYRMLQCKAENAVAGKRYIVRLIAKDINGNIIKLPDGSGQDLWVQELYINFFSETNASLLTSAQLQDDKYRGRRPEELTERFGQPKDKIDYDEYSDLLDPKKVKNFSDYMMPYKNSALDMPPGTTSHYFRWPLPHKDVTYAFGYDGRYDYNNYTVSNSAWATIYNAATTERFDRLYYDTGGKQQGFFYYINAASDPGNMAYLKLDEFCAGSTLYVSAWVQEFSDAAEVANLAINFMAVMKNGERRPIHTFVSGYVPVKGKWYQAYYSFVPDITDIDTQQVDFYEIVLENNCKSSSGADYAIDDIRVYVVSPVVYASQTSTVCHDIEAVDVKVNMPFETLLQSLGREENTDAATADQIDLYYTFLDKDIYDAGAKTDPEQAFYDAVVHFPYRGDDSKRDFGKITVKDCFIANPEYDPKDFTGSSAYRDNDGGERLITFNTRPSGRMIKPGKEFYIALSAPAEGVAVNPDRGPGYELFRIEDPCSKK